MMILSVLKLPLAWSTRFHVRARFCCRNKFLSISHDDSPHTHILNWAFSNLDTLNPLSISILCMQDPLGVSGLPL